MRLTGARLAVLLPVTAPVGVAAQDLGPCPIDRFGPRADCGTLTVAENPDAPSGRRIQISFAVLKAARPGGGEPVFVLAGGPGQGSTALAPLARGPLAPVRETRDIVLVDQRGTGGSNPLACPGGVRADPARAFGHVFPPDRFRRCLDSLEQRADLTRYRTDHAARDLDLVRRALGYERIILSGGSYGTRLAQEYARRFPERVRLVVLDGVVPFDFGAPSTYARTAQDALDRVLADCGRQAACRAAFPDLKASFDSIVMRLRRAPVTTTVKRRDTTVAVAMSAGDFAYAVRGLLYASGSIRRLPAMIHRAAATGDLGEFAQAYWNRAAGFDDDFAHGLHFSIFCAEDLAFVSDDEARRLAAGTFFESYLWEEYAAICRFWPRAAPPPSFREPLAATVPVLLISGAYDPVTPPGNAERVARSLLHSVHLLIPNEAHGAGAGCARSALLYALTRGELGGLPSVCEGAGAIEFRP
jgi:pimeloyl-ACP methyl ester carboxylesterase